MVSDLAFEIVIRVLQHITGPGEPGEGGQEDEPQHRTPRWLKASLLFVKQNKKTVLQTVSVPAPLLQLSSATRKPTLLQDPRSGPNGEWSVRERERDGGGGDVQAAGPLLTTVWQPPIGPFDASLFPDQPMRSRQTKPHRL